MTMRKPGQEGIIMGVGRSARKRGQVDRSSLAIPCIWPGAGLPRGQAGSARLEEHIRGQDGTGRDIQPALPIQKGLAQGHVVTPDKFTGLVR